ncbi:nuclear transport factor 2 family protein [Brevundimonas nasdae]|uniref:Nuclear transport factor 2 family protein n=1 Tax=Brevundimonas nasdae TaxID=172043 RepID=A0ABX8TKU7_9CAUL|nr:nuclear transport factor 2 family protein [Brevundimonas nasdae]QYC14230.1 nuclear transport factor 2 family protein [Brevundimonas nasdae]
MPDGPSSHRLRALLADVNAHDQAKLPTWLADDVLYAVEGSFEISGRGVVSSLWRRMFATYERLGIGLIKCVSTGSIVIAHQNWELGRPGGPPVRLDGMTVYQFRDDLIAEWRTYLDLRATSEADRALCSRLRAGRW